MSADWDPYQATWSGFVAAGGQFPWPPVVRFVAVSGQNLMAADISSRAPTDSVRGSLGGNRVTATVTAT